MRCEKFSQVAMIRPENQKNFGLLQTALHMSCSAEPHENRTD